MKQFTDCRNNADRDKYGLCAAGIAECYEECPLYMKQKKPTNADRIRSMSDRELARWNVRQRKGYCIWIASDGREFSSYIGPASGYRPDEETIALAVQHELELLQQPVKDEV